MELLVFFSLRSHARPAEQDQKEIGKSQSWDSFGGDEGDLPEQLAVGFHPQKAQLLPFDDRRRHNLRQLHGPGHAGFPRLFDLWQSSLSMTMASCFIW